MSELPPHGDRPSAPDEATMWFVTAKAMANFGRLEESIAAYGRAVALNPEYVAAYVNLGSVHAARGAWEEAAAAFRRAVELQPGVPELLCNLGNACFYDCRWDEALAAHLQALGVRPNAAAIYDHVGTDLMFLGRMEEAEAAYRQALRLAPELGQVHVNLATIHEIRGDLRRAWSEWDWRLNFAADPSQRNPAFTVQNCWDGGDLSGRRVILNLGGGYGDQIQYARFARLLGERGGRVIVRCHAKLVRLMQTLEGIHEVVAENQALPDFDLHCPWRSLSRMFEVTTATIPASMPYLRSEDAQAAGWRKRLGGGRVNVGLIWSGNFEVTLNRARSMTLADMAPLAEISGARFFSLQVGARAVEALHPPAGMELTDWTGELHDWMDTAALVKALDLVISVDTGVAHLAGALGKPVWMLLQRIPVSRWMLDRADTPWYPTMRLFRQERYFDWVKPVREAVSALGEIADKMV